MDLHYFAPCPRGIETVLADELKTFGAREIKATDGGVAYAGDDKLLYRVNLQSRIASRVLLRVGAGPYRNEVDLYGLARAIEWHRWFDTRRTIRVALAAIGAPLKSLDYATLKVKDAVCDAFRAVTGSRPNVDTRHPDVRIHVFLDAAAASFYLDTSGEPLFKRGFRTNVIDAPLRENLAAGILRLTGWTAEIALLDPMCGGGTFLLEAATMAAGIAPGAERGFGFERLDIYDARLWRETRAAVAIHRDATMRIVGSDIDSRAIRASHAALERAGFAQQIPLKCADILDVEAPASTGIMVANPPYGVRIGEEAMLAALYPRLATQLKRRFAGWRCFFLTADTRMPKLMGLRPARRTPLYNGALECRLYEFEIISGSMRSRRAQDIERSTTEKPGTQDQ
jgi:putative N6-adenine-specific DNA methylase